MNLPSFLLKRQISQAKFAEIIAESPQTVSRYVNGTRIPEPSIMQKIYTATDGLVTANDFYDLPETNGDIHSNHNEVSE